ncbi:MAG: hypothetical protein Ct9H300mP27_06230 [Chloroflexota bacterium]|nr:MAG: hypothetical protein Ct9H300mP27_06230 [Chloroflexota bacterium]
MVGYPGLTRQEIAAEFGSYTLPENVTDEGWWNKPHEGMASFMCRAERVSESLRGMALEKDNVALITQELLWICCLKHCLGKRRPDSSLSPPQYRYNEGSFTWRWGFGIFDFESSISFRWTWSRIYRRSVRKYLTRYRS